MPAIQSLFLLIFKNAIGGNLRCDVGTKAKRTVSFWEACVTRPHPESFVANIEATECHTDAIRNALRQIKQPTNDSEAD
jgi:hypothetical protein